MGFARTSVLWVTSVVVVACGGGDGGEGDDVTESPPGPIPVYPQRDGDPEVGWRALIEEGYVGCGIPRSAYDQVFAPAPAWARLERSGSGATLPYTYNGFRTASGVEVVAPNCLQCHAETLRGQLVIGLGSHTANYTQDISGAAILAGGLISDPAERAEWEKFRDRVVAVAPYTITRTIGVNPADNLAAILFAHRDVDTLAWSNDLLLPLPPQIVVPVDVPPWWRMQKKHAMFYVGAGRGDHARIMMTASTLCIDSVDEARAIDAYFPDIRAFLLGLQPPAWPFAVDQPLADRGREVFDGTCAACHGTYGAAGAADDGEYPNLLVALDEVGTDPTLATGAAQFASDYVRWFNHSFFGELSFLSPARGYVAPPLDGIWATAPFLHNGSVPTLAALLDSPTRPRYFTRTFGTDDYDEAALGWPFTALTAGQDAEPDDDARARIYDTGQLGYGNRGHTYGDALSAADRAALLEYLKTL
jgi:mono/diheme cytochrome c family protein